MWRVCVAVAVLMMTSGASQAATISASASGGQWHNGSTWVGGVVPTQADDVVLAATSGNVTMSLTQQCRSLDASAYSGTLTLGGGRQLICGYTMTPAGNYVTLGGAMTLNAGIGSTIFCGKPGGAIRGVEFGGHVLPTVKLYNAELLDSVVVTGNGLYCYEYFASNDHAIVATFVRVSGASAAAYFRTSSIATGWFDARTYAVCDVADASLSIGDGANVIQANGVTFGDVTFRRGQYHEIRGDNEFSRLLLSGASAATTVQFQAGKTTTLSGANPLPSGDASGQLTLAGSGAWSVSAAVGVVSVDYVTLVNSQAGGGASFAAGANAIDGGGNTGWSF